MCPVPSRHPSLQGWWDHSYTSYRTPRMTSSNSEREMPGSDRICFFLNIFCTYSTYRLERFCTIYGGLPLRRSFASFKHSWLTCLVLVYGTLPRNSRGCSSSTTPCGSYRNLASACASLLSSWAYIFPAVPPKHHSVNSPSANAEFYNRTPRNRLHCQSLHCASISDLLWRFPANFSWDALASPAITGFTSRLDRVAGNRATECMLRTYPSTSKRTELLLTIIRESGLGQRRARDWETPEWDVPGWASCPRGGRHMTCTGVGSVRVLFPLRCGALT